MSCYGPLYYPYYSARIDLPPSLSELEKRIAIQQQESFRNLAQQQYLIRKNEQLANLSLQAKVQQQKVLLSRMIEAEAVQAISRRRQEEAQIGYLERMQEMRREQDILIEERHRSNDYLDERYISDDQLVNFYQNGFRVQQYQRELRERLGLIKDNHNLRNDLYYKPFEKVKKINQTRQKQKIGQIRQKQTARDRSVESVIGRSYVDDLKASTKQDETNQTQFKKILNLNKLQNPLSSKATVLKNYSLNNNLKKQSKKGAATKGYSRDVNKSYTNRNSKKGKKSLMKPNLSFYQNTISFTDTTMNTALNKISKRLKLSAIVYKDSKLRNQIHQMNHLLQTFEVQKKARKQIKDKINNHPQTLKKHRLVAQSR